MESRDDNPKARIGSGAQEVTRRTPGPLPEPGSPLDNDEADVDLVPLYRKKRVVIPALIVVILAGIALWYWYVNLRGYDSTDDAYIDADRVSVSTKILGRITELTVDEGDTVHAGQVLVRLDESDLRAQEEQAKAALVSAQQSVTLAKVNLDKAADDYRRAEKQFRDHVIPQEQFDHAQKAREIAQAQYTIAVAQVGTAKAQLGVIQTNIQNMTIVAPMNGIVSKRWVLSGDVVQPAQPMLSIYNLSTVWVTANFEETKLSSIRLNDPVEISVDSYPGQTFRGKVIQVGSYTAAQFSLIPPNNASGNFTKVTQRIPVKISIENPSPRVTVLLPGMSVEVRVKVR